MFNLKVSVLTFPLLVLLTISVVAAFAYYTVRIPSTANVHSVGLTVWFDSGCTVPVSSIDWGVLAPGESRSLTIYVRSESNVPSTLKMETDKWNPPAAADYIALTWNYNGTWLQPQTIMPVTFTLTVSPLISNISSFSFDIVIAVYG